MRGRTSILSGVRQDKWNVIGQALNKTQAAILALQETHLTDELAENLNSRFETRLSLHHSPLPDSSNAAGVAFVINKSLLNSDDVSCVEVVPGRAILANVAWIRGTSFKILNVYAPNNTNDNEAFWNDLNTKIMSNPDLKPNIMLGDFNLVEDSLNRLPCHPDDANAVAALGDLKSNLHLVDGWRRTYPDKRGYTHLHVANTSQSRIDRIYVKNDLLQPARDWHIDPPPVESDHWVASVKVSTPEIPEIGRGRWQIPTYLIDNDEILAEVDRMGKKAEEDVDGTRYRRSVTQNPQSILAKFKKDIVALYRARARVIHPTITNKIKSLTQRLDRINNDELTSDDDKMLETIVVKTEILELERTLFESSRVYATAKHHVHAETICRDWTRSHWAKSPRDVVYGLFNPLEEDPTTHHTSNEMTEAARTYHQNLQSRDRDPTDPPDAQTLAGVLENINTKPTPAQKSDLAKPFSWADVHFALHGSANDKAAGLDGIPMELWKKLSEKFDACSEAVFNPHCDIVKILTKVFNDISEHGIAPDTDFNEGWLCPIYKKGERTNIANYRPITVLNTDYKVMTKTMANRLAEAAPTLVHRDQAGFIRGRSIHDQVKLAKLTLDYGRINEQNGAIIALDQEKAYDRILHPYLWKTLEKFGLPRWFITTIQHLYQNATTRVLINGMLSDPFTVLRGVRQGDALSCLLFDLGIEPLAAAIRNSPIHGIAIENTPDRIKCKLFADDTTVYLDESDDFDTLETHALRPWCEVAGAAFNIAKTEVIPVGSREYRLQLIESRRLNPASSEFDQNIRIATEGQPVRILGAWVGNNVDQATPWTPTIEKIALNLKRWEANHPTSEGRRLISQMIIGGMTQYLAKVQGIPEQALKTLERLIKNFSWNGESKPTVGMQHMSTRTEKGGKKVLDMAARNEAIQLTWAQAYLKMGEDRPTWALVADAILRNDATGEPESLANDPTARDNQFLQTWHSRKVQRRREPDNPDLAESKEIPKDLKEMIKIAKKYGVRLEALHPSLEVQAELPATRNTQTKPGTKPDALNDKSGKCLKRNHGIRTLGHVLDLVSNTPNNHRKRKDCRCTKCVNIRLLTNHTCRHPNKCIERAEKLLGLLDEKWNPASLHPPDFFTTPTPREVGPRYNPDSDTTTHTLNPFCVETNLKDCFRVFTSHDRPPAEMTRRADKTDTSRLPTLTIYTDGSCLNNGEETARAGSGVWYGEDDPRNVSLRVPGTAQSNQSAELYAILHALRSAPPDQAVSIRTDSMYAINGLTENLKIWENQGWMYTKHADLFQSITGWIRYRSNPTRMTWVKGHSGERGNEGADKLAREGAEKDPVANPQPQLPPDNTIPSGAKLAALSQKDLYWGVKKANPPPQRKTTATNLGRIQACAEDAFGTSPTVDTIWRSTRHKDLTKKTREFLWKSIHDAFKIGAFWRNIANYEQRGTCTHCDVEESMEHIITDCTAPGREQIWALANELWRKRSPTPIPTNYGTLLGCCLSNFRKENGKPDKGLNRLFRIIVSESMYLIWKLRCERTITWCDDPLKVHSTYEIHNKWLQAINSRLKIDSVHTNKKIFKKKVIDKELVLKTWKNCIYNELHETGDWCGKTGVLVGIAPLRPPGRNR